MAKRGGSVYFYVIMFLLMGTLAVFLYAMSQSEIAKIRTSYELELSKSQLFNQSSQETITSLMNENDRLKRERITFDEERVRLENNRQQLDSLIQVWKAICADDADAASQLLSNIDKSSCDSYTLSFYDALNELIYTKTHY